MKRLLTPSLAAILLLLTAAQCEDVAECAEPCYQNCLDAVTTLTDKGSGTFSIEFENGCTCEVICTEKRKDQTLEQEDPLYAGITNSTRETEGYIYSDTVHIPPDVDPETDLLENSEIPADKVVFVGPTKSGMEQDKLAISVHDLKFDNLRDTYGQYRVWEDNNSFTIRNKFNYYITVYKTADPDKILRVGYYSKERFGKRFSIKR
jgi:hypothetical protein